MEGQVEEVSEPPITYARDQNQYAILSKVGSTKAATMYMAKYVPILEANKVVEIPVGIMVVDWRKVEDLYSLTLESHMAKICKHGNIVGVHCTFMSQGKLWIVMPLVSRVSLRSMMLSSFPHGLPVEVIAVILKQTLEALNCIHGHGNVHKNIGADCLYIDENFSIRLVFHSLRSEVYSSTSISKELPNWLMPQELVIDPTKRDPATDIWMFGLLAMELLYGGIADITRGDFNKLVKRKKKVSNFIGKVLVGGCFASHVKGAPKELREVIKLCLSHNPMARPTAKQLLEHKFFKNCSVTAPSVQDILSKKLCNGFILDGL